jgi:adenine deaminase
MATLGAAECFGLRQMGAVAPGYRADLVVLSDLQSIHVEKVFCGGELVAKNGQVLPFASPDVPAALEERVRSSFCMQPLTAEQLRIDRDRVGGVRDCRVIDIIPGELLTNETVLPICFDTCDGVDTTKDILKLAVIERHHATGEIGLGYIRGMGLSSGAIAASVSHDAHNLIIVGADDADMVAAGEIVRQMGGGFAVVRNRECLAQLPLPIGGLMSDLDIVHVAEADRELRVAAKKLGTGESDPFMTMAFVSLPVIPHLKMTTRGLVDVDRFAPVTLTIN